ncbi:MAG: GH3 auxin-responsive promoter family protein [Deltaproteobacteria bacterium]|nr:GH3 auxin-responsive promoter family protein [Deltaproteobacteria bacterium]
MSATSCVTKWVLGTLYRRLEAADRAPRAAQRDLHERLSRALFGTAIASLQDPRALADLESYRRFVRPTTHADIAPLVEHAMLRPIRNAFERGVTRSFGHTSSGRKHVAFTRGHVRTFKAFSATALAEAVCGLGLDELLEGRTLMIQSSLEVSRTPGGALAGYSSGVMLEHTPWLLKRRLLPNSAALLAPTIDARLSAIEHALLTERPKAITGIPEHVVGVLRRLMEGSRAREVTDALRGVRVYAWSGTSLGPYRRFFDEHLAQNARFVDAVSATEGPLGIHAGMPGLYRPALTSSLLLFVPPDDPSDRRFADELEPGRKYEVWLGSFAGLLGYRTGDVIEVDSVRPLRFRLAPRSLDIDRTWAALGTHVTDFCVYHPPQSDRATMLVESPRSLSPDVLGSVARILGVAEVEARLLAEGTLAKAALAATFEGLIKRPWFHRRPEVHALLAGEYA